MSAIELAEENKFSRWLSPLNSRFGRTPAFSTSRIRELRGLLKAINRAAITNTKTLVIKSSYAPRTFLSSHRFPTAATRFLEVAGIPVLLVERFDRRVENGRVTRIHQKDFCQALGLPIRHKYQRRERGATGYNVAAVRAILDRMENPAAERLKFLHITLFDILLGNVDGHAKNFALFHLPGGKIKTTPRYDVMPTMLDRRTTDEFAYYVGQATSLSDLDGAELDRFLAELGFALGAGRTRILNASIDNIVQALNAQIEALGEDDKNFGNLIGTNIRTLCRNLGRAVPEPARSFDAFVR